MLKEYRLLLQTLLILSLTSKSLVLTHSWEPSTNPDVFDHVGCYTGNF